MSGALPVRRSAGDAAPPTPLFVCYVSPSPAPGGEETVAEASGRRRALAELNRPCLEGPATGNLTQITKGNADYV